MDWEEESKVLVEKVVEVQHVQALVVVSGSRVVLHDASFADSAVSFVEQLA